MTVRAAVAARVDGLPGECGRVLGAAAVLGTRFELDVLAELAAVPMESLRSVLAAATGEGLLALVEPGAGEFRHVLMREAVRDALDPAERAALHGRAGAVLAGLADRGRDTGPAEVARHLLLAGPEQASAAAAFAGRAADRAAGLLAFEDAAQWYEQALTALGTAAVAPAGAAPAEAAHPAEVAAHPTRPAHPAGRSDDARRAVLLLGLGTARLGAGRREGSRRPSSRQPPAPAAPTAPTCSPGRPSASAPVRSGSKWTSWTARRSTSSARRGPASSPHRSPPPPLPPPLPPPARPATPRSSRP